VLTQQPVLLRLQVVLRLVVQMPVQALVQAQQEHLLPVLLVQNRDGPVVLA
jgi:hypothetical protein